MNCCSVVGCDRTVVAAGLCNRHYLRHRRYGDPLATAPRSPVGVRFGAKVRVDELSGCQIWTGARSSNGYGVFNVDGVQWLAHRYALVLAGIEIPDGYHVDHLCRVRPCVNPAHLEPVTQRENNRRAARLRAKVDPEVRRCATCDDVLVRNRWASGRLEDFGQFRRRRFCDQPCAVAGRS